MTVVRQTIAVPVLETPVAPATVQIAIGVTIGFAVAEVAVVVGLEVVVVVDGVGVVGSGDVEAFAGWAAGVVAWVGPVVGAAGIVVAAGLLGPVGAASAVDAWWPAVAFEVTRADEPGTSNPPPNGRCLSGSEKSTS